MDGWVVHYPGRGSRHAETPIGSLTDLVEEIAGAIPPLLDRPFGFFGHSYGALTAFETARLLRRRTLAQPAVLFASACKAPHASPRHSPLHLLSDEEFLKALREFNGLPSEVLDEPGMVDLILPGLRADFAALETYTYRTEDPLGYPILALGANNDQRVNRDELDAWEQQTKLHFERRLLEGGHFFIHSDPDAVIATILPALRSSASS